MIFRRTMVIRLLLNIMSFSYTLPVYIRSYLHFRSISRHHSRYCSPSYSMMRCPCVPDTFFTMKLHVQVKNIVPPCTHILSSKQRSACYYISCYFSSCFSVPVWPCVRDIM
ncbi:hypothetical protein DM01DRAFT_53747 [Hesseltinella vesiculosa]|uniref:Uncharacterized protein n=1 Tax=Hesseltinella vesiculosa TaxID=101127 RepID=A0A1X2GIR1_9FUNG|nr:hypothetical protein DM01DRAFT_53747 [Hesseltinella vesiculosa]